MAEEQVQKSRGKAIVGPLLVVIGAVALFAVAFLITHHGAAKAPPAKIVDARIKPGPNASVLRNKFSAKIGPLVKPVVKKKKKKKKVVTTPVVASAPAAAEPTPAPTPAPVYVPPAAPAASSSSSTSKPAPTKKKTPPSGGGVITVG